MSSKRAPKGPRANAAQKTQIAAAMRGEPALPKYLSKPGIIGQRPAAKYPSAASNAFLRLLFIKQTHGIPSETEIPAGQPVDTAKPKLTANQNKT